MLCAPGITSPAVNVVFASIDCTTFDLITVLSTCILSALTVIPEPAPISNVLSLAKVPPPVKPNPAVKFLVVLTTVLSTFIVAVPLVKSIPSPPTKSVARRILFSVLPSLLNCHLFDVSLYLRNESVPALPLSTIIKASPPPTAPLLNVMLLSSTNKSTCVAEFIFAVTFKFP